MGITDSLLRADVKVEQSAPGREMCTSASGSRVQDANQFHRPRLKYKVDLRVACRRRSLEVYLSLAGGDFQYIQPNCIRLSSPSDTAIHSTDGAFILALGTSGQVEVPGINRQGP